MRRPNPIVSSHQRAKPLVHRSQLQKTRGGTTANTGGPSLPTETAAAYLATREDEAALNSSLPTEGGDATVVRLTHKERNI